MASESQELVFPLRGLSEGWSFGRQPEGTCPSAQNVVPIDSIGSRIRGGQRWGLSRYYPTRHNAVNALQRMTSIAQSTGTAMNTVITWTERQPVGDDDYHWEAVASDSDGSHLIAGNIYRLYTSADSGVTWTERQPAGDEDVNWEAVASDSDGSHLIAGVNGGRLYTSADSGVTWTERQPAGNDDYSWDGVASDSDGSHLIAGVYGGRLYTSADSGVTWTERQPAGDDDYSWRAVASDSDGSHLIAGHALTGTGRLYTSANSGVAWTERQPAGDAGVNWRAVASDSDGSHLIAGVYGGRLYTSADSGVTWTERQPAGDNITWWAAVASDSDGSHLIAGVNGGRLYTSADSGVTWTETRPAGDDSYSWQAVASDSDGSNLIAGVYGERLFTGTVRPSESGRVYKIIAVSGGDIYTGRPNGILSRATLGLNALATSGRVDAQPAYGKTYFCDGVASHYKVLDNVTDAVSAWTPVAGSLPVGTTDATKACRMIALYRGRIVMAGLTEFPHNWYMSKVNAPLNWDYGATTSAVMAVAGNNTDAGECPDIITCLASYSDDLLYIGGDHTLWVMTGDPADRGRLDNISDKIGVAGPDAFTFDSSGVFYFFGMGTIWKLTPGGIPEALSRTRLDATLAAINLRTHTVHLHWDNVRNGLFIFVVPSASGAATHYYWDQHTDSFWKIKFPNAMGPSTAYAFDGDNPDDNALLLGGWDGYIRYIDPTVKNDDSTAIDSFLLYPPIAAGGPERNTRINRMSAILDTDSDDVTLGVYAEDTVQKVIEASESIAAAVDITAVNQATKTFTVAEDWSTRAAGDSLLVAGSTGNDGSYILVSATGAGPTALVVVGAIPDDTVDGTIQYRDRTRISQVLSGGRNTILRRIAGNAIMVKLHDATTGKAWAIENLIISAEATGRTRKNQL